MKLKTTLTLWILFLCIGFVHAQKVKIKKDIVYFDGVAVLKSDVRENMYSIYDLKGDEIVFIRPSVGFQESDLTYTSIKFLNQRVNIETTENNYIGISRKQSLINIIKWLLRDKVLTSNGEINVKKLGIFHYKYHEEISKKYAIINSTCKHDHDCDKNGN